MILSKSIAEKIVSQLSKIVEQHINIMDIEGVIISSTDPNRVNSIHGGAVKIINEKLDELMIFGDDEFVGAKNGINLPIYFNGEIVGVIGMTGRHEDVYNYGQIIKKMTEILLLEFDIREQYIIEQKARDRFLEEWVFGRYESVYPNEFQARAERLGIDVKTPKSIIAFSVRNKDQQLIDDQTQTQISHRVRTYFRTITQAFLFRTSTLYICVVNKLEDEKILEISQKIKEIVFNEFGCLTYIGFDNAAEKSIQQAFKNANYARQLSIKSNQHIHMYDALNLDLYITKIPLNDRVSFIDNFLSDLKTEEIEAMINLLKIYYEEDGSIEKISNRLFIHRNTLQYQIQKIIQATKKDPRKLSDSYLFIIAIKIYESIKYN